MVILLDARAAGARMHGIARYTRGLVAALARDRGGLDLHILVRHGATAALAAGRPGVAVERSPIRPYTLGEQWAIPRRIRRTGADLYHSTTFTAPIACPVPSVVTIYDLTPIEHYGLRRPLHLAYYLAVVRAAARRAASVVTVSRASARSIARRLGVARDRIAVIPPGLDTESLARARASARRREGFTVAAVGGLLPHKNLGALVRAFESFARGAEGAPRLVLLGELDAPTRAWAEGARPRVEAPGPLEDEAFLGEIASADAFVFPSLAEGFGLPPLEAMGCGVPVLASRAGALPETLGDAALYFDPRDPAGLARALERLAADAGLRRELAARGLRRAARYRWEDAAAATRALYRRIARTPAMFRKCGRL